MNESSITGPRFLSQDDNEFRNEKRALEANMLTQPPLFHVDLISSQIDAILLQIKIFLKTYDEQISYRSHRYTFVSVISRRLLKQMKCLYIYHLQSHIILTIFQSSSFPFSFLYFSPFLPPSVLPCLHPLLFFFYTCSSIVLRFLFSSTSFSFRVRNGILVTGHQFSYEVSLG
jgi:hypothetical protein